MDVGPLSDAGAPTLTIGETMAVPCVGAARAVAASYFHTCLVLSRDGSVWCWGQNQHGELGNGTTLGSNVPVAVLGW
jgi:alpha-tubulin suppressor-like RCC1 family protein